MDGNLRSLFQKNLRLVHWQSIETGMTGRGVPDSNGCYQGAEFWVEFKQTGGWNVTLRPEQIGWLDRRARCGGNVYIAVRRKCDEGPRRDAADELWIFHGRDAIAVAAGGLRSTTAPLVGFYTGGPTLWNWAKILEDLTGRR